MVPRSQCPVPCAARPVVAYRFSGLGETLDAMTARCRAHAFEAWCGLAPAVVPDAAKAAEPAQYAQWELLWGTLSAWNGTAYRDAWDLWHDAPDLQFRLSYKERVETLDADAQRAALDWLEAGERPANDRVRAWLLAQIANAARAWLDRAVARGRVEVTFLDDLGRTARVVDPGTGGAHRFEHLYGCWRRVEE